MKFYEPSDETLAILNGKRWICSFSGGKDSTALVTWIEWLRRIGIVKCDEPRLVMSNTEVEFPFLQEVSRKMMDALTACGWKCQVVRPLLKDKLYNQIFGRGSVPIHPGMRNLRWCTRATKIDPMERFGKTIADDIVQLTGVRYGESKVRDGKLKKRVSGCVSGGECGLPVPDKKPGRNVYGPIIQWKTCQVVDWLQGGATIEQKKVMSDLLAVTYQLIDVYEIKYQQGLGAFPPQVTTLRFGCIGCPAIGKDKLTNSQLENNPQFKAIKRIYFIWEQLWKAEHRLFKFGKDRWATSKKGWGPIKMASRKRFFAELLDIQKEAGIELVNEEDVKYIEQCWHDEVYPRGWSIEDENTRPTHPWQ